MPIFVLTSIQFDRIVLSTYKAKCLSNNQYVVLQGDPVGDATTYDEVYLNSSENRVAIMEQLNFYCKYYDEIQPHIIAYNEANTSAEYYNANIRFSQFKDTKDKVYAYPELYKLEVVSNETHLEEIYYPLLGWLMGAVAAFVLLQIVRMCYVYVVFGKLVWHPFKKIENN